MSTELTQEQRESQQKMVRDATCRACLEYIYSNDVPPWQWARCWAKGLGADGIPNVELNTAAFIGPAEFCPLGRWLNLVLPTAEQVAAQEQAKIEHAAATRLPLMLPLLTRIEDSKTGTAVEKVTAAFDEMVALWTFTPEIRAEIEKQLAEPKDVERQL